MEPLTTQDTSLLCREDLSPQQVNDLSFACYLRDHIPLDPALPVEAVLLEVVHLFATLEKSGIPVKYGVCEVETNPPKGQHTYSNEFHYLEVHKHVISFTQAQTRDEIELVAKGRVLRQLEQQYNQKQANAKRPLRLPGPTLDNQTWKVRHRVSSGLGHRNLREFLDPEMLSRFEQLALTYRTQPSQGSGYSLRL